MVCAVIILGELIEIISLEDSRTVGTVRWIKKAIELRMSNPVCLEMLGSKVLSLAGILSVSNPSILREKRVQQQSNEYSTVQLRSIIAWL